MNCTIKVKIVVKQKGKENHISLNDINVNSETPSSKHREKMENKQIKSFCPMANNEGNCCINDIEIPP